MSENRQALSQKERDADVKSLVFDLQASSRSVRLSAAIQLQHFLNVVEVKQAFGERLKTEDDEEIRFYLESGFRKEGVKPLPVKLPDGVTSISSAEELVKKFAQASPDDQQNILRNLAEMKSIDPGKVIQAIVKSSNRIENILAVLSAPEKYFSSDVTHDILVNGLKHANCVVVQRSLQILSKVSPGKCLPHLPKLLLHKSETVRAMSILALNRICPPEAKRLLGEFLESDDSAVRGIGLAMLFYFPFEEISGILFDLVERRTIPDSSQELIRVLVKSNPDKLFMSQLAMLTCRRPGDVPMADELLRISAEGLHIAGLEENL